MIGCFWIPTLGVAVERARTPSLAGVPLALVGEGDLLVVVSAEAVALGVALGQKQTAARALCPTLVVLPYDPSAYERAAHVLWDRYAEESSQVEPVSPELCFVGLTGFDPARRAATLAAAAKDLSGMPVCAGLGRTAFIAEQVARLHKTPLAIFDSCAEHKFINSLTLSTVPALDPKIVEQVRRLGVERLGDLAGVPRNRVSKRLRPVWDILCHYAKGGDTRPVAAAWPPTAVIGNQRFEPETDKRDVVDAGLLAAASRVAEGLWDRHVYCRVLTLTVTTSEDDSREVAETLKYPVADTGALCLAAGRLFDRLAWNNSVAALTLTAGSLGTGSGVQLQLFDPAAQGMLATEVSRAVAAAVTGVRSRYGEASVQAVVGLHVPTQTGCFTESLGALKDTTITVETDSAGTPLWFVHRDHRCRVLEVQDRWREERWLGLAAGSRTIFRVQAPPFEFYELERRDRDWRVRAAAD